MSVAQFDFWNHAFVLTVRFTVGGRPFHFPLPCTKALPSSLPLSLFALRRLQQLLLLILSGEGQTGEISRLFPSVPSAPLSPSCFMRFSSALVADCRHFPFPGASSLLLSLHFVRLAAPALAAQLRPATRHCCLHAVTFGSSPSSPPTRVNLCVRCSCFFFLPD